MAKVDILGNLPIEISYKILMRLTLDDIDNALKCCKTWRRHMSYSLFWKSKFQKYYSDCQEDPTSKIHQKMSLKFSNVWQGRCMYQRALERNFFNKNFTYVPVRVVPRKDEMIYFDDQMLIIVGSIYGDHNMLYVINSRTGLVEKVFTHSGCISAYSKCDDYLLAITTNKLHLKMWNLKSGKCTANVYMHSFGVLRPKKLLLCKHLIFISTSRSNVFVYDTETAKQKRLEGVMHVCSYNDVIALKKSDMTIEITDLNFRILDQINVIKQRITLQMAMNDEHVIEICKGLELRERNQVLLRIWNFKTKIHRIINDAHVTNFCFTNNSMLNISFQNRISYRIEGHAVGVWDLQTSSSQLVLRSTERLQHITQNDRFLFTSSGKSTNLKIWCLKTGQFVGSLHILDPDDRFVWLSATNRKLLYSTDNCSQLHILDFESKIR